MLLMLPVFVLVVAAYAPGRIKAAVKHPMVLAVKIWAFAHLLANGDLASVLLFGSFLAWGVVARISLKKRQAANPHGAPPVVGPVRNDVIAIVVGPPCLRPVCLEGARLADRGSHSRLIFTSLTRLTVRAKWLGPEPGTRYTARPGRDRGDGRARQQNR